MKSIIVSVLIVLLVSCQKNPHWVSYSGNMLVEHKVDSLLKLMSLDEKIGQLNQYSWNYISGDSIADNHAGKWFKLGMVGSTFNVNGIDRLRRIQEQTLQYSRLKIPMIFAGDVGNGYSVEFPVPLAESCSWNMELMQRTTRVAAEEATASGICWTFAPMVDISRDPRWGRVQEGGGEDPFLASQIAIARVKGYQNIKNTEDFSLNNTMLATLKHFAGYGAAQAGRDYHQVDMSDQTFRNVYLQPFSAAIKEAKAATIMSAFNELNGVPCSGNPYLLKEILRNDLGFRGLVVSDYTSINEMIDHGFVRDQEQAAELAFKAGVDVDMIGENYVRFLKKKLEEGSILIKQLDQSVARILELKFLTGLFDDPYRYLDKKRQDSTLNKAEFLQDALESARQSIVLLRNSKDILPLKDLNKQRVLMVGPYSLKKMFAGPQPLNGGANTERDFNVKNWFEIYFQNNIQVNEGCSLFPDNDQSRFESAVESARHTDLIIAVMGEDRSWIGEGNSRAEITLPGEQRKLLKELKKTGKPMILILFNGRPLDLSWENENMDAIVEAWFPGMMGGQALMEILKGDVNPSAKLTMTFPRNAGQIPIYYNRKLFASEYKDTLPGEDYNSNYLDQYNSSLYPFGYGKSYSKFKYRDLKVNKDNISIDDSLKASVVIRNESDVPGIEIVQLYLRQCQSEYTPNTQDLAGFKRVEVPARGEKEVSFNITADLLSMKFLDRHIPESGRFELWISQQSGPDLPKVGFNFLNPKGK